MIKTSSGTVYYTQQEVNNKINEVMEDGYRITNAIYEEACERDWCDMYDEWADNVNRSLKFFEIPNMRREYAVTFTIERTQKADVTVTVTATSDDDAESQAQDAYDTSDLVEKIDDSDWQTTDESIENYTAQES
jgi:hypothetical protein